MKENSKGNDNKPNDFVCDNSAHGMEDEKSFDKAMVKAKKEKCVALEQQQWRVKALGKCVVVFVGRAKEKRKNGKCVVFEQDGKCIAFEQQGRVKVKKMDGQGSARERWNLEQGAKGREACCRCCYYSCFRCRNRLTPVHLIHG